MTEVTKLAECIEEEIIPYKFKKMDINTKGLNIDGLKVWSLKNWNINRAIVLIPITDTRKNPGEFVLEIKNELGKMIGYIFFISSLGLQVVLIGENILLESRELLKYVDTFDNQRIVLQSIYLVDLKQQKAVCGRTWGQYISGKYQNAIAKGIDRFLGKLE